jgi:hypothetical protein
MKKETTLDELAGMVQRGFTDLESRIDKRFDRLEKDVREIKTDVKLIQSDVKEKADLSSLVALEKRVTLLEASLQPA